MQKQVNLGMAIVAVLLAMLVTFAATFLFSAEWTKNKVIEELSEKNAEGSEESIGDRDYVDELSEIKAYFDNLYIGEMDEDTIVDMILAGYVAGTEDKYAHYYNADGYKELQEDLKGELEGIGVSVIYNADYKSIEVIDVFPDSPAYESGIQVGDLIVSVGKDEEIELISDIGYYAAIEKIKGPKGTATNFTVYRGEDYSEHIDFEVVRDKVVEQTVKYRIYDLDSTVGVIKISGFDTETVEQFKAAVEALKAEGAEKLVFDVRNNPGGELNSICSILDYLLPEGPVVRIIDKSQKETVAYTSDAEELDMPMSVVVNSNTASAAELFTSALKDYEKAVIVGTLTYGKGCMQTIYPLKSGGAISLTTALYCPPVSDNYNEIGVSPDIESELTGEAAEKNIYKLTDEEDTQLADAVAALNK